MLHSLYLGPVTPTAIIYFNPRVKVVPGVNYRLQLTVLGNLTLSSAFSYSIAHN